MGARERLRPRAPGDGAARMENRRGRAAYRHAARVAGLPRRDGALEADRRGTRLARRRARLPHVAPGPAYPGDRCERGDVALLLTASTCERESRLEATNL